MITSLNSEMPIVTVVIVCYQHALYVKESIFSVLEQTYPAIQLIVIDDGSSDESPLIIKALAAEHNFECILQKNAGLTVALNKGLQLAKGKYFIYLGADDKMCADRIIKQVSFMENNTQYAVCAGNALIIDSAGTISKKQTLHQARQLNFDDVFTHSKPGIRAPTAMIKIDILREVGGYNTNIALEDIYLWLKISSKGYLLYVMDDVLAYYRKHGSNQSKNILFMADNIMNIYAEYRSHPKWQVIVNTLMINLFLKAARRNYPNALEVLKRVPWRCYNAKVLLGLFYLLLARLKIRNA